MAVCLEQGADLHMAQLMPLPLTVSCIVANLALVYSSLMPVLVCVLYLVSI